VARMNFKRLVAEFITHIERLGATVLVINTVRERPAELRIIAGDRSTDCMVFLWTITAGGGVNVRPINERRIQITKASVFPLRPGVRTIVGGLSLDDGVWAFWDPRRHSRFSARSPSLQTKSEVLQAAYHDGIATQTKPAHEGTEVVVAVRPDALLWYVQEGEPIHDAGTVPAEVRDLVDASPEEERGLIENSATPEEAARRYDLTQIMRAFRDARFRPAVLRAYAYRCAVCGVALKLVDAAHIVPVSHPQGNDEVPNGMALCRLHHGAYDTGLLGVRSDYRIIVNTAAAKRLAEVNLDAGLQFFKNGLPAQITLPAVEEMHPDSRKLRMGMEVRRFPPSLIG